LINCKDCQLFEDKYCPCENPENMECTEFFPKEEVFHKYMWILLVDLNLMMSFIKTEAKKQKNYILSNIIERYEKQIKNKNSKKEKKFKLFVV